jgi:polyribonucleotide nucleotidyltransferase
MESIKLDFHGAELEFETGLWAKQAHGSIKIRYGETIVLVTAVTQLNRRGVDFFPLVCDYFEKVYSAGKIPGGFFKREGRQTEKEILTCRLIDRPIRPSFPAGFRDEVQIVASVISKDDDNEGDVLAITAASAAIHISKIPFNTPLAAVRVGRIDGEFICNPTHAQIEESDLNMVVAGTRDAIVMVEGGADFLGEDVLVDALEFAHDAMQPLIDAQDKLRELIGVEKMAFTPPAVDEELKARVDAFASDPIEKCLDINVKMDRYGAFDQLRNDLIAHLNDGHEDDPVNAKDAFGYFNSLEKKIVRRRVIDEGNRIGGRAYDEVRPIECQVGVLPRPHGTALFTRGETQALVVLTLGTRTDEQKIESLTDEKWRRFLLHYNFPPYSVGEVKMLRGPNRREIGHGALARRALVSVVPTKEEFPYTIRLVSEILESNGSSSMASVCGGSLAMMQAGVPTKAQIAGVAMGLMQEGDKVAILTDILGDEDHMGDMDFKVAGSAEGVSAIQMDIKIAGLTKELMATALEQARKGRLHILGEMNKVIDKPAEGLSDHAPRIVSLKIPVEKIKDVIGPGGKIIRSIIEETGVRIDVEDDGTVLIASTDGDSAEKAIKIIKGLTTDPEVGKYYMGKVVRIMDFGAFVEIMPGTDGLLHISQLDERRIDKVEDVVNVGDEVLVQVLDIDPRSNKIRLSRKAALGMDPAEVLD